MSRVSGEILMVGSIPFDTAEAVFRNAARYVGPYVSLLPDGEFGPRTSWIGYLAKEVYDGHPEIDTLQRLDESKPTSLKDTSNKWMFRVKPGAKTVHLHTGYAEIALASYESFRTLRQAGVLPAGLRFQVCFPSTASAFISYFDDPNDWPTMAEAYEGAFRRDVARLVAQIPATDLAIQLDICVELRDMQDTLPWSPPRDTKFAETIGYVARLGAAVPSDVVLGLHWCYGTLGGWPMVRIANLDLCTRLTNAAVAKLTRPVDYVHLPVLRQAGDAYFAPLGDMRAADTRIYLGLIHHTDGMEGFVRRLEIARRHVPDGFGVASVCGYGRLTTEETRQAFELHQAAGAYLRAHPR